ncbi:MAG: hypothetical protein ABI446_08485 [Gemmatimonadaceae bacterium]
MATAKRAMRTCEKGHRFYKTSSCPTCPKCEATRRPTEGFLAALSAPARRALERAGITSLRVLSGWSKEELLQLHGVGPSSIPKLQELLARDGLTLKE